MVFHTPQASYVREKLLNMKKSSAFEEGIFLLLILENLDLHVAK